MVPDWMKDTERYAKLCSIVDPSAWPSALKDAIQSGDYIFWKYAADWIILLSVRKGDLTLVRGGGRVQARMAINLVTGEARRSPAGVDVGEWEAELGGRLEELRQKESELKEATDFFLKEGDKEQLNLIWDRINQVPGQPRNDEEAK